MPRSEQQYVCAICDVLTMSLGHAAVAGVCSGCWQAMPDQEQQEHLLLGSLERADFRRARRRPVSLLPFDAALMLAKALANEGYQSPWRARGML